MKKRVSQETKNKIGRGVKTHYDKKGRKQSDNGVKKKVGLALAGAGLGVGLLALKKRGAKPGLGTPQNPYVERAKIPGLPDKVSKSTNQARRGFTDTLGRVFKKGRFLPKGVSDIGLVRRAKRPIDATKQVGRSQEDLSKAAVGASNTQASDKWLTIDVESKRFSRHLSPYTVNFTKDELVHTVPTKIQSLVKDSISRVRINFAKEEKVDSYTTKKGKRVRSFNRKRDKKKKHLLDDKATLDRYVSQSQLFDKRVTAENAKEVFDAEEDGAKKGKLVAAVASPLALYGLGRLALKKGNVKEVFQQRIKTFDSVIDNLTAEAQKGAYKGSLNRVAKVAWSQNEIGELGSKGLSKNMKAFIIGKQAKAIDTGIGVVGKGLKGINKIGNTISLGTDVIAGPANYRTRLIKTRWGPQELQTEKLGSILRRKAIPSAIIGVPITIASQNISKEKYFKDKEKEKKNK